MFMDCNRSFCCDIMRPTNHNKQMSIVMNPSLHLYVCGTIALALPLLFRTAGRVVVHAPDGIVEPERNSGGTFAVPLKSNAFAMIERKER